VKRSACLFLFLLFSLAGYSCQVGRFYTASLQYNNSRTYNKSLTKKFFALTLKSFQSEKEGIIPKGAPSSGFMPGMIVHSFSSLFSVPSISNVSIAFNSSYYSTFLVDSSKRGPPAFLIS